MGSSYTVADNPENRNNANFGNSRVKGWEDRRFRAIPEVCNRIQGQATRLEEFSVFQSTETSTILMGGRFECNLY